MQKLAMCLIAFLIGGCGDSPTEPALPEVGGIYTGDVVSTMQIDFEGIIVQVNEEGTMRVVVGQEDGVVSMSGWTHFNVQTELPRVSGTIDEDGVWTPSEKDFGIIFGSHLDVCGISQEASIRFSETTDARLLNIELVATPSVQSVDCPKITVIAELTRRT